MRLKAHVLSETIAPLHIREGYRRFTDIKKTPNRQMQASAMVQSVYEEVIVSQRATAQSPPRET